MGGAGAGKKGSDDGPKKKISVEIPLHVLDQLDADAKIENRSRAGQVRDIIEKKYLSSPRKRRENEEAD
jgi:metal-responsive CopG/Arc/MetJ family transcriptional regulator